MGSETHITPEKVEQEGLTRDDVLDREFATPQEEVKILPVWEECPEERPGENLRIEDGELCFERDGFEVRLACEEPTIWRATVTIPDDVGKWFPRGHGLKARPEPEHGYVDVVDNEGYVSTAAELVLIDNYQPVFEIERWIDGLLERRESSEAYEEEFSEVIEAARENEKAAAPGDGEWECPECELNISQLTVRDEETVFCPECHGNVADHVTVGVTDDGDRWLEWQARESEGGARWPTNPDGNDDGETDSDSGSDDR